MLKLIALTTSVVTILAMTCCLQSAPLFLPQTVTLTGVNGASVDGFYTSPYYLTLGTAQLTVFCDDLLDQSELDASWQANVYSGLDLTGTYFAPDTPDYAAAFWLVDASLSGAADPVTVQQALWGVFDPAYSGSAASEALREQAAVGTVDLSHFLVIDDINTGAGRNQEFIMETPTAGSLLPSSPEPTTLVLCLAGGLLCALAGLRRRRCAR